MLVETVTAPRASGLGDDVGFALVILGVQHFMLHAHFLEKCRQMLGFLDGNRADQNRLAAFS